MKHISRKLSLELASIAVVLLVFAVGFLALRISQGPTQIDFMKPFVEAEFYARTGLHLQMQHLSIEASGEEAPVAITAIGMTITGDDGATVASVQSANATISRHGLLAGDIHPIAVAIDQPIVFLAEHTPASEAPEAKKSSHKSLLHELAEPKQNATLAQWEQVTIKNGSVAIGTKPLAGAINASLQRTAVGLQGSVNGTSKMGTDYGQITGAIEINRGQKGTASLHSGALLLSDLSLLPGLSFLQTYTLPVEATVTANFTDTVIADARLSATIGAGQVIDDSLPAPLKISGGSAELVYQAKPERVEFRQFDLDLGGPKISVGGYADSVDGKVTLDANARIDNLPIDRFAEFWPPDASAGGRKWVLSHLSKGKVPSATAHVVATAQRDNLAAFNISSFDGAMNVSGATVQYFGELPEVKNASADIDYNMESMTIHMTGGQAEGLSIKGGTIVLTGFSQHDQAIKIDLNLSGPVSSALGIVDHPPLNYAKKLSLKSGDFGGTADTRLQMNFPLIDNISVDQLNVTTQSDLHDVSMPDAVAHKNLQSLNGTLYVGMGGLELIGTGALIDIPLTLDYRLSFEKNGPTVALFSGSTDNRQRGELGLDFPDRLQGKVDVSGKYNAQGNTSTVDVALDLTPALFAVDEIGYAKPKGQPGSAKFLVSLQKSEVSAIDPLTVEAPKFVAKGSAHFDDGKLTTLTLDALKTDDTNMRVTVTPLDGNGSKIDVTGTEFDARRFLHKRHKKEAASVPPEANPAPLEIDIDLAKVETSDMNGLTGVKGQLVLLGRKWQRADFTANAENGSKIFLSYLPDNDAPQTSYTLNAGAADAGAALAGFALTDSVKGGALTIKGKKAAPSEAQPNPSLGGALALSGFRVTNPPGFARLFNLLSLTGFGKAITSSDIHFDSFKSNFEVDNAELRISDGRLVGDAIGLTIAGTVDRDGGTMDLYGTAVPAYGANRILNSIPVLGPLLTGGDGQGIFAATYSITGPFETASVSLNPLSVFAPGVLRDLLFGTSDPDMDSGN